MLADCTMDIVTNLLISYMVFVYDTQKLPKESHLKAWVRLSSSAVRVQLSHAYRKVDKMSNFSSKRVGSVPLYRSLSNPNSSYQPVSSTVIDKKKNCIVGLVV